MSRMYVVALAVVALMFVVGCQNTQQMNALQGKIDELSTKLDQTTNELAQMKATVDALKADIDIAKKNNPNLFVEKSAEPEKPAMKQQETKTTAPAKTEPVTPPSKRQKQAR